MSDSLSSLELTLAAGQSLTDLFGFVQSICFNLQHSVNKTIITPVDDLKLFIQRASLLEKSVAFLLNLLTCLLLLLSTLFPFLKFFFLFMMVSTPGQ